VGTLGSMRTELETRIREQLERGIERMNLVRREEFDAVQEMAAKARAAQEALEARVAALEARLAAIAPATRRSVRLRPPLGRRPQKPL